MKDEALRLALEALEIYVKGYADRHKSLYPTITAIKQALEQPEPEPRVWIDHRIHAWPDCFVMQPDPPHTSPLYTSPPKREPLTDEQIEALRRSDDLFEDAPMWRLIARAIEAAHGIKGEQ